jgi:hypothetical protein
MEGLRHSLESIDPLDTEPTELQHRRTIQNTSVQVAAAVAVAVAVAAAAAAYVLTPPWLVSARQEMRPPA